MNARKIAPAAPTKVIRDAGYAHRLEQACDSNPHCPAMHHGRQKWIADQLRERFNEHVSTETVRRWYHGEVKPRLDKNNKVAELLMVDPVWLYQGIDSSLTVRERKVRNATADGAVNLVAGLIQMDGGSPAFPDGDAPEGVDLFAIIKGAQYSMHIALGEPAGTGYRFSAPAAMGNVMTLGVIREGMRIRIADITDALAEHGQNTGGSVSVTIPERSLSMIESFTRRI